MCERACAGRRAGGRARARARVRTCKRGLQARVECNARLCGTPFYVSHISARLFAGVGVVVGPAGRGGLDPYDKQNGTQHGKQGYPPNPRGFQPTNCATCARVRADPSGSVSLKPIKHKTTTVRAPHLVPTARRRFVHALACVLGYVSLCICWSSYRDASSFLTAYGDASPFVRPGWAPPAKYLLNFCMDPPATSDVKSLRFARNQCHEPCSAC